MNWAALAAGCSFAGLIVTALGVAYIAGQLKQKIQDNTACIDDHEARLGLLDARVGNNAIAIARLEAWKEGFSAAAHTVRRGEGT